MIYDLTIIGSGAAGLSARTNIDAVFAAGDIVNHFGRFKQDITVAAMGAVATASAYEDHKIYGDLCMLHVMPPAKSKIEVK